MTNKETMEKVLVSVRDRANNANEVICAAGYSESYENGYYKSLLLSVAGWLDRREVDITPFLHGHISEAHK
jgi:hypothetical protein